MAIKVREGRDYRILPDDYRAEFHKHNKPVRIERKTINGAVTPIRYYRCMYCGRLVPHTEMQVDHIIPKTRLMAGILWNPNKSWNLGPSCPTCNISKSNYIDGRVIKGFRNKLINKYGLSRKFADMRGKDLDYKEDTTSGDSESLKKIMPFIMILVYALGILKPVIIIAAWILQAAMWAAVRLLKLCTRFLKWTLKKLKKSIKYYLKHPKKLYKLAGKIAIAALVIYAAILFCGGVAPFFAQISTVFGGIWAWGSGLFK